VKAYCPQYKNSEGLLSAVQEQWRPADLNARTMKA